MVGSSKSKDELIQELSDLQKQNANLKETLAKRTRLIDQLQLTQYSIDNIADSIFWIDRSAKFHYVNNAACKNLGYSKEELLNMNIFDVDPVFPKDKLEDHWQEIIKTGSIVIETIHRTKDGKDIPVEVTTNFVEYNGSQYNCAIARNITERKQIEQSLIESEERFKALHNASFGGITIHDKGKILECNQGLSEITGYTIEELIGMDGLLLIAEKSRDFVMNKILTGYEKPYEAFGVRKNGEEYPIRLEARNVPYKGKSVRTVEFRDITEQKNAEKELRESETRYKALHNASFGGIGIHDKGIILECNHGLSEMTGFSYDELIGMNGLLLIAEKSRDFVMNKILTGYEKPYEAFGVRKNGEEYPMRLEARNVPYKGKNVRTVEFRDITEQKSSEKAIRESEQRFKELANLLPQTIFETDNKMNVTFINKEASIAFGYSEKDIKQKINAIEVIVPEDREKLKENFKRVFTTKSNSSNEYTGIRKDGSTFPIIISSSLIIKDNIPIGVRGIIIDITERKQAEEDLQKQNKLLESQYEEYMQLNEILRKTNYDLEIAKKEAEDSNKTKSIFLANMSHELRTPLVGILGYSDLLMKFIEDEELSEMASGIHRTGKRLLNTISLILDLSKIEADNFKTNIGEHDCINMLKETFENLKGGALAKNLEYTFVPHNEKCNIKTDAEMFRIIFENILSNAIKFTYAGKIEMTTKFENNSGENLINIMISDTGIGIDQDDIPQIFEEFKQLSEGTTKNFPGSGLGLSITKKFVELLNGNLQIRSAKDIGTTVEIKFKI
ncbi:MAG: PAS domain S-box protein [Ignavibacteriales bacterium]|nr:PAS domain S-box protein [Ignavibacteriales bacterium]MCB9259098.1 PAS domain S-box protein [Ignavibacteriales bacterium]